MSEVEISAVKEVCTALKLPANLTTTVKATLQPTLIRIPYYSNELGHELREQQTRAASLLWSKTEQRFRPIKSMTA